MLEFAVIEFWICPSEFNKDYDLIEFWMKNTGIILGNSMIDDINDNPETWSIHRGTNESSSYHHREEESENFEEMGIFTIIVVKSVIKILQTQFAILKGSDKGHSPVQNQLDLDENSASYHVWQQH